MKEKKKNLTLPILLGIMLILTGGYVVVSVVLNHKEEAENQKEAEAQEENRLFDLSGEDATSISYNGDNGELAFSRETAVEDGSEWIYTEDEHAPVSQEAVDALVSDVTGLTADRVLEEPDDLQDYGLEEPFYTIRMKMGNDDVVLHIGDASEDGYYANQEGKSEVYVIPAAIISYMSKSLDDYIETDEFPTITSGNLRSVTIAKGDESVTYEASGELSGDEASDGDDSESEGSSSADDEAIIAISGGLGAFTTDEFVSYYVEDKDLGKFDLDEKNRTSISFTYMDGDKEKTMIVYIGKKYNDGNEQYYYVRLGGSMFIYRGRAEVIENILNE